MLGYVEPTENGSASRWSAIVVDLTDIGTFGRDNMRIEPFSPESSERPSSAVCVRPNRLVTCVQEK